jgi:glutathione S-transferase
MSSTTNEPVVLYHHPFSRASGTLWALEEVGVPYELRFVDIMKGAQKAPELVALNPMGKIPVLTHGDAVVTEAAAIALYLADRFSYGTLAPRVDDPARGAYLRWSLFPSAVIEPAVAAKTNGWSSKESQVGWGTYATMLDAIERAVSDRKYVAGDAFTMADVVLGGTLRYMLMVKQLDTRPAFTAYLERVGGRPALGRADQRNAKAVKDHGLRMPSS